MVTARVNGKAVKIPQRFTVQEWIGLQRWDFDAPVQWPHILEQITLIPQETFRNADEESLQLFMGFVISSMNSRQRVELPDFNKLTFGQFVDMDCFMTLSDGDPGISAGLGAAFPSIGWAHIECWSHLSPDMKQKWTKSDQLNLKIPERYVAHISDRRRKRKKNLV